MKATKMKNGDFVGVKWRGEMVGNGASLHSSLHSRIGDFEHL